MSFWHARYQCFWSILIKLRLQNKSLKGAKKEDLDCLPGIYKQTNCSMSAPYLGGWFVCMFYVQCNKESKNDILCLEMCTFISKILIDITKFIIGEETVKSF